MPVEAQANQFIIRETRLIIIFPSLSLSPSTRLQLSFPSRANIFNDKIRIENDKLKKRMKKKSISVVGKQFGEACFSLPSSFPRLFAMTLSEINRSLFKIDF